MTGISPLQSIHTKGLFGNHHKKNENELIKISEVKNLIIIQINQFKNSKVQLNATQIDGLDIPTQNLNVASNKNTRIVWNAPNTWLVISKNENIIDKINENYKSEDFAVTDLSHSRAIIQIQGQEAKEVLKKGCPLNFNEFKVNNSAGSVYHGINILIDHTDDQEQIFNLITLRSFGEALYHHVTDAALEFGYIGV